MESIDIGGKQFQIHQIYSKNKNANARLKENVIVISIPSRWSQKDKDRVTEDLRKRAIKAIEKGTWNPESNRKLNFDHGQRITALGEEFQIALTPALVFRAQTIDNQIEVRYKDFDPEKENKIRKYVIREILKKTENKVVERIEHLNNQHFSAELKHIRIKDTKSIWGSMSPKGAICLNFRLLLMPTEILDYVIVHELAHTKYKSHGKRFWDLVARVMPEHKIRRRWLKKHGWTIK
ncbi:M48 family metallopeptidase [Candidatus Micrarchaeota archaeon]|nr:M48 family metallopeptidase [Candidatus Micrarchaeota archaeon]MBU1166072.1 M48 family metallopeptidase [Candidatus Micrarchaeota archaeon]MBU1886680.1 M48 family metallopeptidase [Candidatus Micrarchaeota archaeon]